MCIQLISNKNNKLRALVASFGIRMISVICHDFLDSISHFPFNMYHLLATQPFAQLIFVDYYQGVSFL